MGVREVTPELDRGQGVRSWLGRKISGKGTVDIQVEVRGVWDPASHVRGSVGGEAASATAKGLLESIAFYSELVGSTWNFIHSLTSIDHCGARKHT